MRVVLLTAAMLGWLTLAACGGRERSAGAAAATPSDDGDIVEAFADRPGLPLTNFKPMLIQSGVLYLCTDGKRIVRGRSCAAAIFGQMPKNTSTATITVAVEVHQRNLTVCSGSASVRMVAGATWRCAIPLDKTRLAPGPAVLAWSLEGFPDANEVVTASTDYDVVNPAR